MVAPRAISTWKGTHQGWENSLESSPGGYICQTLFRKFFFFQNIQFIYNCSVYSFTYKFISNL